MCPALLAWLLYKTSLLSPQLSQVPQMMTVHQHMRSDTGQWLPTWRCILFGVKFMCQVLELAVLRGQLY